ncbi:macro domain-containing protein [Alkalicoccus halolimnae]|uniref:Macro domain-containing protein n=1 Tax=Alkalicoccus halolimnae TaxID=1667239 RepID=A0A5C7F4S7_9BACI|nr:macro domain-containing protein [Alkalicoccus halolimnae]TXF85063.1 RNase III inhibitor [Alkalicoccus halolimnae]
MELVVNGVTLEIVRGDITRQPGLDCIVSSANAQLKKGEGVSGDVHRAAGPTLDEAARRYAPVRPGEVRITEGYHLPNDYIIHCRGPAYGKDYPADVLLFACYRNIFSLAEKYRLESIAIPAIATGGCGYPMQEAAEVALQVFKTESKEFNYLKNVRFVLYSVRELVLFKTALHVLDAEKELT